LAPAGSQEHATKRRHIDLSIFAFLNAPTITTADQRSSSSSDSISHAAFQYQELVEMNKKRSAPGAAVASAGSSSKKRKMDGVQKYYAVRAGFNPGVYLTYPECQQQTSGFRGAVCEYIW
jgi:hypothetical protein